MTDQAAFEERLRRQIDAYHEAALVYAAVKLGLPDRLAAGPATSEQLAASLGLSTPHLTRFLRGLCSLGICEELPDGAFALTTEGECLLTGSPSRLAEKVQIVVGQYWWPWANFASSLKSGKPAFEQMFGAPVFDWRRDNAAQGALFKSYLAKETQADTKAVLAALGVSASDRVVQFDGADAGPLADIPAGGDLYLLKGVLQNYDDQGAAVILRNCRKAMPKGARLAIIERLLPERATDDPAAIMLDLHMMTITGGRVRSLADFTTLLSEAGLALTKATPTSSGLAILEIVPQ
jgi:O-methyltransferase domain/Dimerisation domain